MARVIDAFTFFNEVDILHIRLRELWDHVDTFLIVESGQTFGATDKPFFFDDYADRFAPFLSKIELVRLNSLPPLVEDTEPNRFGLEAFQRNAILFGLTRLRAAHDDLVLISDVDEIPSPDILGALQSTVDHRTIACFKQRFYKHYFDCHLPPDFDRAWLGTVAVRYSTMGSASAQQIRRNMARAGEFFDPLRHNQAGINYIDNAGWHLTYFGGAKAMNFKLVSFAHGTDYKSRIASETTTLVRESAGDLLPFDRDLEESLRYVIDEKLQADLPRIVSQDLAAYYHLFGQSLATRPANMSLFLRAAV